MTCDQLGRLFQVSCAATGANPIYDSNGNRTSLRKRDGSTLTFQYDALGRMSAKAVPERAGLDPVHTRDVFYEYDLRGLQTRARFDSASGEGVTNAYDGFGQLLSSTSNMGGTARSVGNLYDPDGNRIRVIHPDGSYFTYDLDGLDRPTVIRENGGAPIVQFTYDNAGRRATSGWAAVTSYAYDPAGRLQALSHNLTGDSRDLTLGFTYNPASQILARSSDNDAFAWRPGENFARSYAVNGLNQYTSAGPATFTHDPNGNLASTVHPGVASTSYVYDVENRLVSASGTHNAELLYDPLGRLWQVSSGTGIRRLVYDGDALVAEYDTSGNMPHRYIHGNDAGDDPLIWYDNLASGWRRALLTDHQGSIVQVADMYGQPVATNSYDPWGIPGAANAGRFGYTGQTWVPELGLWYYKARFYSPTTGRFLQVDPVGYKDQMNLYAYVGNDSTNQNDPTGKDAIINITNGSQVHIILPVVYGGAADSPTERAYFESNLIDAYAGEKGVYNVTVEVRGPLASDPISPNSVKFENLGPDVLSTTTGGRSTTINLQGPGLSQGVEAHEGGHLLGNPDRYSDNGLAGAAHVTTPHPGFEGNIMGALGQKQTTDQRDITGAITAPNNHVTYKNDRVSPF